MNKIISVIIVLVFVLTLIQPVNAASDYAYLAEITSTSFLPATIHAGDTVSMAINIHNKGTSYSIEELKAELDLAEQFEAVQITDNSNTIIAGATKTIILKFKVKETTLPGYYNVLLNLTYLREGKTVEQTQNISVPVSQTEKNIDVVIEPRVINPGKQTELIFSLKNVGGNPVSNISFSWEEANDLVLPLGSDNKRYINSIEAGETSVISYIVAADPNISTGIYPLDITMKFIDVNGTKTQTSQVGLIVGGGTDFEISAETSSGQLSLSIANIGSNNAESVIIRIPEQAGVTVSGSNIQILGNLNKGDYTIASFTLGGTASSASAELTNTETNTTQRQRSIIGIPGMSGGRPNSSSQNSTETTTEDSTTLQNMNFSASEITINIEYTDTTGERQTAVKTISLGSGTASTTAFNGMARQTGNQNMIPGIALLLIVVGGGIAFNKFKAKKTWKKTAIVLGVITIAFLAGIFLLNFDLIGLLAITVLSIILYWWYFFNFRFPKTRFLKFKGK